MLAALLIGLVVPIALSSFVESGAKIETIASDLQFTEGPAVLRDGWLIFSDIPASKIYRWKDGKREVWRSESHQANGNHVAPDGSILTCEHGSRQVTRTDATGKIEVLVTHYEGKRLNSPNDICQSKAGVIYFTDPPYGVDPKDVELPYNALFMIRKGKLVALAKDFDRPNGVVLSPDEKFLYVADTTKNHIRRFEVQPDGELKGGAEWAKTPHPDGLRVDHDGRVWSASNDGVNVIDPSGKILEVIAFPQVPANLTFSRDGHTLYVTARTAVYSIRVTVKGCTN